jgi:hypothetical protein
VCIRGVDEIGGVITHKPMIFAEQKYATILLFGQSKKCWDFSNPTAFRFRSKSAAKASIDLVL